MLVTAFTSLEEVMLCTFCSWSYFELPFVCPWFFVFVLLHPHHLILLNIILLNCTCHRRGLFVLFFWLCYSACRILVPWPRIEPMPPWQVLTTGLPGKPPQREPFGIRKGSHQLLICSRPFPLYFQVYLFELVFRWMLISLRQSPLGWSCDITLANEM